MGGLPFDKLRVSGRMYRPIDKLGVSDLSLNAWLNERPWGECFRNPAAAGNE